MWCLLGTLESLRLLQSVKQFRPFAPVFDLSDGCIFFPGYGGRRMMENGDPTACTEPFLLPLSLSPAL